MITEKRFQTKIKDNGFLLLDGGLATHLESMGEKMHPRLWSAGLLDRRSESIKRAHLDYLNAGADCITTASYQASIQGFMEAGYSKADAKSLITNSVDLASQSRSDFLRKNPMADILIAASIGPYGAYLADGSEYTGHYQVNEAQLMSFHAPRWEILLNSDADLIALETIPNKLELEVLASLLKQSPDCRCWISLSCQNARLLCDGTAIIDALKPFRGLNQVLAIGINCCSPLMVTSVLKTFHEFWDGELMVYPNSGEIYDTSQRQWREGHTTHWGGRLHEWWQLGVRVFGGCCRIGPKQIMSIKQSLRLQSQRLLQMP